VSRHATSEVLASNNDDVDGRLRLPGTADHSLQVRGRDIVKDWIELSTQLAIATDKKQPFSRFITFLHIFLNLIIIESISDV